MVSTCSKRLRDNSPGALPQNTELTCINASPLKQSHMNMNASTSASPSKNSSPCEAKGLNSIGSDLLKSLTGQQLLSLIRANENTDPSFSSAMSSRNNASTSLFVDPLPQRHPSASASADLNSALLLLMNVATSAAKPTTSFPAASTSPTPSAPSSKCSSTSSRKSSTADLMAKYGDVYTNVHKRKSETPEDSVNGKRAKLTPAWTRRRQRQNMLRTKDMEKISRDR